MASFVIVVVVVNNKVNCCRLDASKTHEEKKTATRLSRYSRKKKPLGMLWTLFYYCAQLCE